MDNEKKFEVVVSGISGKFPSSEDTQELKEKLLEKQNLVTENNCRWDKEKWKVPSATGKIGVVGKFDDTFFGIYSGVAAAMDPVSRITIERAYEAIMDAGLNPKCLRGSRTAVYTGSCTSDSEAVGCDEKLTTKFWLLAHARSLLANRISYVLNLQGPSWSIDSTWLGGVECLRQAVDDIRKGRVENALVGVTNVISFPDMSQHWMDLGKLSPDGSCRPFEDAANGYGRSEGVVFLFLQRADEAKRIYATVAKAATTFCGDEAHTLLKPKEEAFVKFFENFYSNCEVPAKDVAYLEADGSADKYLDEIELNSIGEVLCKGERDSGLYVGAMKSNVGHLEGASSLASVTKALISLDSEIIMPHRAFQSSNKNIKKLRSSEMKVVTNATTFPNGKFAAVNAIGLCTSVGHVLLKQNPKTKKWSSNESQQIPRLILLSSRHEPGLLDIVNELETMPYNEEYFNLINDVFKEHTTGHFYKGFTILGSAEKKIHFTLETPPAHQKRPIWFVFSGMGSQWPGMGADLMKLPIFAQSIKEIDTYLAPLGIDIVDVITSYDPTVLRSIVNSFVGIIAMQIAMVDVIKAAGIEPVGMFGHSLGENACAYADGCFTKYQAIMAAYFRGRAISETCIRKGLMVAVGLRYDKLPNLPDSVEVACHNSNDNTTLSGPYEDVERYVEQLKSQNIFVRTVNSNFVAYHSNQVKPAAPFILDNIRKVVPYPKPRSPRWISTSIPERDWDSPLAKTSSGDYHVNNFLGTVYFAEACAHVPEEAVVIEISPHGLFQGILKRMLPDSCFIISMEKRETSNTLNFFLSSIGKLYAVGVEVDVNAIYPPIEYPVPRGTPSLAKLATWNHEKEWKLNTHFDEVQIKPLSVCLAEKKWRFLTGYKINEKVMIPFGLLLVETLKAYETNGPVLIFEYVNIPQHVEVSAYKTSSIRTLVRYGSGIFEIMKEDEVLMNGSLRYSQEIVPSSSADEYASLDDDFMDEFISFSCSEVNDIFKENSMEFSEHVNTINRIIFTNEGMEASITWSNDVAIFVNSIAHTKIFYDLCMYKRGPLLPAGFLRLSLDVEKYRAIKSGAVVNITYNKYTNVFSGPGIELIGLENTDVIPKLTEHEVQFQDVRFVPHDNPVTESIENFLSLCGQLVGETFDTEGYQYNDEESLHVTVLIENDLYSKTEFKTVARFLFSGLFQELLGTQIDVKYVNYEDMKKIPENNHKFRRYLVVCESVELFGEHVSHLANKAEDIFLLTFKNVPDVSDVFVKIIEEKFEQREVFLWKKSIPFNGKILKITPHSDDKWLDDVEEEFQSIKPRNPVAVQWCSENIIDIMDIMNQINTIEHPHSIRYILMADKDKIDDQENTAFYKEQLNKGLVMNVFKNGKWGSVRNLQIKNKISFSNIETYLARSKWVKNVNIEYVTASTTLNDIQSEITDIEYIEYSGTDDSKRRVMGIVKIDKDYERPEILFQWPVPELWSLEDAVTVPLAYVKVYYAFIVKGKLRDHSSVLVHSGDTILGEAAITVALSMNCKVYTSAANARRATCVAERFRNPSRLVVFNDECHRVDVEILNVTERKGVDVVVNANTDKRLQQSLDCLKEFGTILQFSEWNRRKGEKIGMATFLKSTNFCGISNMAVLQTQEHVKTHIQNIISEAIKNGVITPFRRIVCDEADENTINRFLIEEKENIKLVLRKQCDTLENDIFLCDPEKSYLIVGNSCEIWFTIVTWLLQHNAKKLVFIETDVNDDRLDRYRKRLNIFVQNRNRVSLMHLPASSVDSAEECSNAIRTANNYAKLDVVFCVSVNSERAENIDLALRTHATDLRQFVCVQSDVSRACESRRRSSLPALNVVCEKSITNGAVVAENITKIIRNSLRINSSFLYLTDTSPYIAQYKNLMQNQIDQFFLKYSEAEQFVDDLPSTAVFEKAVSKCSYYCTRTQLFPVFVIPGLHPNRLKKLIKKLMYPVFCAKIPATYSSANHIADDLIESLKRIQARGPYTIVGESWSGAAALELTKLLEQCGDAVQLILLEGIPRDMQNRLSSMGMFGSRNFLDNLCNLCFENRNIVKDERSASATDTFDAEQTKFLALLQQRLVTTFNYCPNNVKIRSKVIAVKLADASVLNTYTDFEQYYSQEMELKLLEEEQYENLIGSDVTATIINDNVLFKW